MNYFDNELNIMEWFRYVLEQHVWFPVENEQCVNLYLSLSSNENFAEWINSSGKADPPPDFYNPQTKMMMDVMRIDDHGHTDSRGRFVNPVNQRESAIQKELRTSGFLDAFPNVQSIFVNAVTDLSEHEDHNYGFYLENFIRTVEKHIKSIPLYQKNHPGYKTVFFVFDESCGYVLAEDESQVQNGIKEGEAFFCSPYLHFADKRFVEIIIGSGIDYFIWFSPFKHFDSDMPELPSVCVYDVSQINLADFEEYPQNLIMSTEA